MANNFSATSYIPLFNLALEEVGTVISPVSVYQVPDAITDWTFSAPVRLAVELVPPDTLGPVVYVSGISFLSSANITAFSNYIGGSLVKPNIINRGAEARIYSDSIVMANVAGTGNCNMVPPDDLSYLIKGVRIGIENLTGNYTIPQNKSGYVWTNTSGVALTVSLTTDAKAGTNALFIRTGDTMTISPPVTGKIWHSASGQFRDLGTSVQLATSGAKLGLMTDGNNNWYPTLEEGTIN